MKKYFNWANIRLVLIVLLLAFLYAFTTKRNENRKLCNTTVEFQDGEQLFITHEMVNKLLIENKRDVSSIRKVALDLNNLENTINQHEMVEKAEVFVSIDGHLKAVVKQKTPVARIFEGSGSYYVDYKGTRMPLSAIHTARVPLVSGGVDNKNKEDLYELFRMIHDDEFLKKNIIGIQVLPSGSLIMKNRNFNYDINFGKTINMEKKFKNYKAFFQKAVQDSSIYNYRIINLKFTQQVVCTK
ncbi:cell division protein FtsQ/DivIB [Flavobacterium sp.]|uniref:cell division protein FtsQ/DivIB n=1 Tax=Flavobacterium sp. TaxID=239 RepID=UPI003529145C